MASDKRANPALWRIAVAPDLTVAAQIEAIVESYGRLTRKDAANYPPLLPVSLRQRISGVVLNLYIRNRAVSGFYPFVADYLVTDSDRGKFTYRVVDACLFIATQDSLFAVTSGTGYRIFEDFADYAFPFDTARKLVANNFTASDVRELAGPRASRTEIYRRAKSISSSEAFGKVWKRLVGRLNTDLLSSGSYLGGIIDKSKPPAIEVKSSFTIRKSLTLAELASLAQELQSLPPPPQEQLTELAFLDNLYVVKNGVLVDQLQRRLIENLRQTAIAEVEFDLDICDPDDIAGYQTGSDYRLSRWPLPGDPPTKDDVIATLREHCDHVLDDPDLFHEKVTSLWFRYDKNPDEDATEVKRELHKFMHAQVEANNQTYFLLDKIWYQASGDYLGNLKRDFLAETFSGRQPIFIGTGLELQDWSETTESAYNRKQAGQPNFYFGDEIFAVTDRGKVELFDLLKVDPSSGTLYVIHVKDSFDAKMRDACSQISTSRDVISRDLINGKETLRKYYRDAWLPSPENAGLGVDEATFLSWFDLDIVYVVAASTRTEFTKESFDKTLTSHIARREIIVTRNEFRATGETFRLAHTKRTK